MTQSQFPCLFPRTQDRSESRPKLERGKFSIEIAGWKTPKSRDYDDDADEDDYDDEDDICPGGKPQRVGTLLRKHPLNVSTRLFLYSTISQNFKNIRVPVLGPF